ncbi:class I SAM-dependent methyltransferase [Amnibacterium sp.]|uniref:class I SAM-dependent methyltransferase n=1 Tax=Amnibacterium sp. TaxID=1872496 RepID=UPI0026160C08|nr:class I SAM-dependent methyltransferase [Amnibacterium sp.]MCU1472220.1 SAM-dependent methyltransferase [Amnibacterium sp.]
MSDADAGFWDAEAEHFDESADHGLRDPAVRAAWRSLLDAVLPATPADVADLGCGTGSLALLAAEAGHRVTGVDFAPRMLDQAARKSAAARLPVSWILGDAAAPPLPDGAFDVVLERHVLWALPDPAAALAAWGRLLRPHGVLALVEGRWWTGAGLPADEVRRLVEESGRTVEVVPLPDPALWGAPIEDERYLVLGRSDG